MNTIFASISTPIQAIAMRSKKQLSGANPF
jgi:hypothetical protein